MKMRLSTPAATRKAWLTAGRLAAGAVLLAVTASACTSGGSSVPSTFTPSPLTSSSGATTATVTHTPSPNDRSSTATKPATATSSRATGRSTTTARATATGTPSSSATSTHSPRPPAATPSTVYSTVTQYPTAAPETGGGGTAGLQDGVLFGIGGASVLAGLGFLAMRRRLARRFSGRPAPHDPADRDREPAER